MEARQPVEKTAVGDDVVATWAGDCARIAAAVDGEASAASAAE